MWAISPVVTFTGSQPTFFLDNFLGGAKGGVRGWLVPGDREPNILTLHLTLAAASTISHSTHRTEGFCGCQGNLTVRLQEEKESDMLKRRWKKHCERTNKMHFFSPATFSLLAGLARTVCQLSHCCRLVSIAWLCLGANDFLLWLSPAVRGRRRQSWGMEAVPFYGLLKAHLSEGNGPWRRRRRLWWRAYCRPPFTITPTERQTVGWSHSFRQPQEELGRRNLLRKTTCMLSGGLIWIIDFLYQTYALTNHAFTPGSQTCS